MNPEEQIVPRGFDDQGRAARGKSSRFKDGTKARETLGPLGVRGTGIVALEDRIEQEPDAPHRPFRARGQCGRVAETSNPEKPVETGTSFGMSTW